MVVAMDGACIRRVQTVDFHPCWIQNLADTNFIQSLKDAKACFMLLYPRGRHTLDYRTQLASDPNNRENIVTHGQKNTILVQIRVQRIRGFIEWCIGPILAGQHRSKGDASFQRRCLHCFFCLGRASRDASKCSSPVCCTRKRLSRSLPHRHSGPPPRERQHSRPRPCPTLTQDAQRQRPLAHVHVRAQTFEEVRLSESLVYECIN